MIDWNLLKNSLECLITALIIYDLFKTKKEVKELKKYQRKIFDRINELETEKKSPE